MISPIDLENEPTGTFDLDAQHARMKGWIGDWRGTAKTWLEPGKPPLEAAWEGRISSILGGRFVRFAYRSSMQGKPFAGELTIAYESGEKLWRTSWIDSFHTGSAILVCLGEPGAEAIDVRGRYFAAPGHPHWGWRTELLDATNDALTLRMYNVSPDGEESLGVEVSLQRA